MRILGVSDGPDAGAALVVDDRLVAVELQGSFDGVARSRAFPWDAVDDVLRRARVRPVDIDAIAVAGRIWPPFFLRRRPGLRRVARDPFSWVRELGVLYQATLRETGIGALEADRAADWLRGRFADRGFRARVQLVDAHTALANAAYRGQPDDDALLVTMHPLGDGVSLATHRGTAGQIDRLTEQRGLSSLHLHLARCAAALGCPEPGAMWAAAGGRSEPALVAALARYLRAEGGELARDGWPWPEDRRIYERLRSLPVDVAAGSVHENLRAAVAGVVAHHVARAGTGRIAVGGEIFENTRLVADLADVPGVESVACLPAPGRAALALGAACALAGSPPRWLDPCGDDPDRSDDGTRPVDADRLADALRDGGAVAFATGASGPRSWRSAERCLVRRARHPVGAGVRAVEGGPGAPAALAHASRSGAAEVLVDESFAAHNPFLVGADGRALRVPVAPGTVLAAVLARLEPGAALAVEALPGNPARWGDLRATARRAGCAAWVTGDRVCAP